MFAYRENMRLYSLGFSNTAIAGSIRCSHNTASEVIKLAEEHGLEWPLPDSLTNEDLQ